MPAYKPSQELTENIIEEMFMRAGNILIPLIHEYEPLQGEKENEPPIRRRDVCIALAASIQDPQSVMNKQEVKRMLQLLGLEETDVWKQVPYQSKITPEPYQGEKEPWPPMSRAEVFLRIAENISNPLGVVNPKDIEQLVSIKSPHMKDIFRKSILGK